MSTLPYKYLQKIHVTAKELQITDENRRELIFSLTGKTSSKDLTPAQARRVISRMETMAGRSADKATAGKYHPKKDERTPDKYDSVSPRKEKVGVFAIMTPDQRQYIADLCALINAESGPYQFTPESRAQYQHKKPFEKLRRHEAQSLINGLKAILYRIKKQKNGNGGTNEKGKHG